MVDRIADFFLLVYLPMHTVMVMEVKVSIYTMLNISVKRWKSREFSNKLKYYAYYCYVF